jgi:isopenicillin-N epimerase
MVPSQPPVSLRPGLKSEWLLDDRTTFLNHGSFGACPRAVVEEQNDWRRRIEAEPIELIARRGPELLDTVKRAVGQWLRMPTSDFGLVTNATEGINAVLRCLKLSPGDELLSTNHVYFAVRQAMRYVAGEAGAVYREIDLPVPVASDEQVAGTVLSGLSGKTRLLVIDHITSPTALVFPIERIVAGCADRGVDVLVDGAHGPGMVPLNVPAIGAAYYAGNLHKWACCPKGSAFIWARPDRQAGIHPLVISHYFGEGFEREFSWQGTRDMSAWLTVPRALQFMADLGWERVMGHNHAMAVWVNQMLCDRWGVQSLSPPDGQMLGSMATVPLPVPLDRLPRPEIPAFQQRLYSEHHIEIPVVSWGGRNFVRPCCQVYNVAADYERLADVILAICSR